MKNRTAVTPFFLDRAEPDLAALAGPGDPLNDAIEAGETIEARLQSLHRPLANFVARTISGGERPISIAGDCCAAIPVLAGLQRAGVEADLVWLDAHGDFNTPETTPSGFLGGMPLAMMTGRGDLAMCEALGLKPHPEERIVLADARDLDPGEREAVEGSDMTHVRKAADLAANLPGGPLYVHFDTDIIDARDAPAQHYPVEGGPSLDQTLEMMAALAATKRVIAVSMTCWNPALDGDGKTAKACMQAFRTLIG